MLGFLFAGFGVGALAGAIVAQQVTQKVPLLKLAALAIVGHAAAAVPALADDAVARRDGRSSRAFAFFVPLVNAPIVGLLTRAHAGGASAEGGDGFMTVATMAGPFGFIAAGYLLQHVALGSFFIGLPALLTLGSLAFAAVLLRHREGEPADVAVAA